MTADPFPEDSPGASGDPLDAGAGVRTRIFAIYLTVFFAGIGSGVAVPILPEVQSAFGLGVSQVVLVISVWAAARLVTDLPLGVLVDRLPRGRLLLTGTLLLMAGATISMLAPTFEVLLAGRAVTGAASALLGMTAVVTLLAASSASRRGRTLGAYQAFFQAGYAIGPMLAGFAAAAAGWPAAFAVAAGSAVIGTIALIVTGAASTGSAPRGRSADHPPTTPDRLQPTPLSRLLLLGAIHSATFVLFFVTGGIIDSALPLLGAGRLGLDVSTLGLILGGAAALRFVVSFVGAELSDRVGRMPVLVAGMAVLVGSLILMPFVATPLLFALATWSLAIGRLGNSIPIAMLGDIADPRRLGRFVSVNRFVADAAFVTGPLCVGWLIEVGGFGAAFGVTAILVAGSTAAIVAAASRHGGLVRASATGGAGR